MWFISIIKDWQGTLVLVGFVALVVALYSAYRERKAIQESGSLMSFLLKEYRTNRHAGALLIGVVVLVTCAVLVRLPKIFVH